MNLHSMFANENENYRLFLEYISEYLLFLTIDNDPRMSMLSVFIFGNENFYGKNSLVFTTK